SNSLCLFTVIIGFIITLSLSRPQVLYNLLILGFFFSASLRFLVIRSIFTDRVYYALLVALIQPALLSIPIIDYNRPIFDHTSVVFIAPISIITMVTYVVTLDRLSWKLTNIRPFKLLKAFLLAWAEDDKRILEEILEKVSIDARLKTFTLSFEDGHIKPLLVISNVHSGPLHPVGSYNIPYEIYKWFYNQGYKPLVFHSISTHEFDLPSEREIKRFLQSMNRLSIVSSSQTCTQPYSITVRKATATGIAFGKVVMIILTLSPHGMEDIPQIVKERIDALAYRAGFIRTIVIDAHNSQGEMLSKDDCDDLIEASEVLINKLKDLPQYTFKVGVAHSSEFNFELRKDVGPAGIGVFVIEVNGNKYSITVVDANNAIVGFRENLMNELSRSIAPQLELCTTDTHFSAGRIMNAKGYLALGSVSDVKNMAKMINVMVERAVSRLVPTSVIVKECESDVRVIGKDFLSSLSIGLDKIVQLARKGGILVTSIFLLLIMVNIYL
ncbi:MAG: DUF2070 family protein, partial [Nitrososphaerales archaeon]|nr:DUF2070 family protein [Nitrososphaerales archaeon]